jgi:hypothetical protein
LPLFFADRLRYSVQFSEELFQSEELVFAVPAEEETGVVVLQSSGEVQVSLREFSNEGRIGEPTVGEDMAPVGNDVSGVVDHGEQNVGSFGCGFDPSFPTMRAFVDIFIR